MNYNKIPAKKVGTKDGILNRETFADVDVEQFKVVEDLVVRQASGKELLLFGKDKSNRDIVWPQVAKLVQKFQSKFHQTISIVDEDLNVIDGQHTLHACYETGKPFYFVVIPRAEAASHMIELNTGRKGWSDDDLLNHHIQRESSPAYPIYKKLLDRSGLSHASLRIVLFGNRHATKKNFETGEMKIGPEQLRFANEFIDMYQNIYTLIKEVRAERKFIAALRVALKEAAFFKGVSVSEIPAARKELISRLVNKLRNNELKRLPKQEDYRMVLQAIINRKLRKNQPYMNL